VAAVDHEMLLVQTAVQQVALVEVAPELEHLKSVELQHKEILVAQQVMETMAATMVLVQHLVVAVVLVQ
jgi:hypothetical protein